MFFRCLDNGNDTHLINTDHIVRVEVTQAQGQPQVNGTMDNVARLDFYLNPARVLEGEKHRIISVDPATISHFINFVRADASQLHQKPERGERTKA